MTLVVACFASTGAAQEWSKSDEHNLEKFHEIAAQVESHALASEWSFAKHQLDSLKWFLDKWAEGGHANRREVVSARKTFESLARRVARKSVLDPEAERAVRYVCRETGSARKGGTRDSPAKFFWRELEKCTPGDEIRVSGPIHGWRKSGKLELKLPHLKIRGGYSPDFSARDHARFPSVVGRPADSNSIDRAQVMVKVSPGDGVVLDGLIFDQKGHNTYDGGGGGNLDAGRSRISPTLALHFSGNVTIRNCIFLNSSFSALLLAASGKGEAVVENCIFLNCTGPALRVRGEGGRFLIRNNTFALIHPRGSSPGACIELGSNGTLIAEDNLFAYADHAVTALLENLDMTLNRNVEHGLGGGFLLYAQGGRTSAAPIDELEEVDLNEAEGNSVMDPDLNLHPTPLLKYLLSTHRVGWNKERLAAEVSRAEARRGAGNEIGGADAKAETDPKKDDPLGDDPFADPSPDPESGADEENEDPAPPPAGSVSPGAHFAPAYPAEHAVCEPANASCAAGARAVIEEAK